MTDGLWGALIGAAIALVAAWMQGRQQRKLAHDDRLWSHRAELYVDMLLRNGASIPETGEIAPSFYPSSPLDGTHEQQLELAARVDAFASDAVRGRWRQAIRAAQHIDDTRRGAPQGDYASAWDAWEEARSRLAEAIRSELRTAPTSLTSYRGRRSVR